MYDQGIISLDDDISIAMGYNIRNPFYPDQPITYRMLLSHQSTLIDGDGYSNFLDATFNNNTIPNISELITPGGDFYTSNMWLNDAPGNYFSYSNINYGLIGTLIEKLSGMRFDMYMKTEILEPMNITGSYNVYDLPNINDLSVLYRYTNSWQPQVDNYQGNLPSPPDLGDYEIGSNGLLFSPQGGLRTSASELGIFLDVIAGQNTSSTLAISQETLNEMPSAQWTYNGTNGNNYFNLFNSWGLGLHIANGFENDAICNLNEYGNFIGHPGEAYGLISDAFYQPELNLRFAYLINGKLNGYTVGNTAFYNVEEAIFGALCNYFETSLDIEQFNTSVFKICPNPTKETLHVTLKDLTSKKVSTTILTVNGKTIHSQVHKNISTIVLDIKSLEAGIYFLKVITANKKNILKFVVK